MTGIQRIDPLSPIQEGLLYHSIHDNYQQGTYIEQYIMNVHGKFNADVFSNALNDISKHHDIIRTSFVYENIDRPARIVWNDRVIPFQYNDLRPLSGTNSHEVIEKWRTTEHWKPFNVAEGPLIRVTVFITGENSFCMLWSYHHLLMDGYSFQLFIDRFLQTYEGMLMNKSVLHSITATDDHYVQWLSNLDWDAASDFWASYLEGYDTHHLLPKKRKVMVDGLEDRKEIGAVFDEHVTSFLREFGSQHRASLNMVLQTLWAILLQGYTNSSDVIYGLVTSLRNPVIQNIEHALGVYINTIPVRVYRQEDMTLTELLQFLQQQSIAAYEHSFYPLHQIQVESSINQDLINHILLFNNLAENSAERELAVKLNNRLDQLYIENIGFFSKTHYPLQLEFTSHTDQLKLTIEYDQNVFSSHFIHAIPGHLKAIIDTIMAKGDIRLQELEIVTGEEKNLILIDFNESKVERRNWQSVYEMFEHQVLLKPEHIAIDGPDGSLSYRELHDRVSRRACVLQHLGFSKGDVVGLLYHRSEAFVIQALAVLKAGLRYVPLDPEAPSERNEYILSDSGAKLLLTEQSIWESKNLAGVEYRVLWTDDLGEELGALIKENWGNIHSHDGAYIIYTSGTTGKPKGVEVQHQSIIHLIEDLSVELYKAIDGRLRVGQFAPFFFDQSVEEIFGTLLLGHTLIIANDAIRLDKHKTLQFLEEHDIDMMNGTPSYIRALLLNNDKKLALKRILVGGESIPYPLLKEIADALDPRVEFYNVYGPTECCVDATYYKVDVAEIENLHIAPIGKPMGSKRVYIMDEYQRIQPIGVEGEIIIGGTGVASGYKNLPDMNAASFVKDPFCTSERMYRTGDRGRWLPNGNIEFMGRNDRLVKLHGYRIELEEIEERLLSIPGVREAVVILKEVEDRKFLSAFIISPKGAFMSAHELKEKLAESVPHYMIPATVHFMNELPVSATGKIDRKALLNINTERDENAEKSSPLERRIAALWEEVLHIEDIQPQDHFFELGGHSLYATMLVARANQEFKVKLSIKQLYLYPTVAEFAKLIERSPKLKTRDEGIIYDESQTEYPLTSSQMRLYLLQQRNGASTEYNISGRFRIQGKFEKNRIEKCFATLIEHNEMLRTSFQSKEERIVQVIHPPMNISLQLFDKEPEDNEWIHPFNLSVAPLFRVFALPVGQDQYDLLIDMHHIITDGVSNALLLQQFIQLYNGASVLPETMPFKHYAQWQQQYINSDLRKIDESYWLERLAGDLSECGLPSDFPRRSQQASAAKTVWIEINEPITESLQQTAQRLDVSLFSILLAAYNVLMYKYSGLEDVVLGSTVSGRTHHDVQNTIGLFVNTVIFRNYPSGNKPFSSFVIEVANQVLDDLEHQDYPFDALLDQLGALRSADRNPLFDIMFVMQNRNLEASIAGNTSVTEVVVEKSKSKFDLLVEINEFTNRLTVKFEYNTGLYHKTSIERHAQYYLQLLEEIAHDPMKTLDEITIIRSEEAQELLTRYDRSQVGYPIEKTIHGLFQEQVIRTPHHVALIEGDNLLTYEQMDWAVNQLANYLQKQGIEAGMVVGVAMERSIDAVIAIMAILKTGGAYLPLDRQLPEERLAYIISHSQARLVISDTVSVLTNGEEISCQFLHLAAIQTEVAQESVQRPDNMVRSDQLAYMIYTSGTTGKPKGVMIEHSDVVRLIVNDEQPYTFEVGEVWTLFHSLSFDYSVWEMFGPLLTGGKLVIVPQATVYEPQRFMELLVKEKVTILNQTPASFYVLSSLIEEYQPRLNLKIIICSAEALHPKKLINFHRMYPNVRLINMYGVTETTVFTSYKELSTADIKADSHSIGLPLPTLSLYILDKNKKLCLQGGIGELYVGGQGVARGYLGNAELNCSKFVRLPDISSQILYRTGDLMRILGNGELEYVGRADHQVKLRGYRIELPEIEEVMLEMPGIKECMVLSIGNYPDNYLCGYYVAETEGLSSAELQQHLLYTLPRYCVPSKFVQLDRFPLTVNGKVDRRILIKLAKQTGSKKSVLPRNNTEQLIANEWSTLLDVEPINMDEDFFENGGNSLQAALLANALQRKLQKEVTITDIFRFPTVAALAQLLAGRDTKINLMERKEHSRQLYYPLALAQNRIFLLSQHPNVGTTYNIIGKLKLKGELDHNALHQALRILIRRHDVLRSVFTYMKGKPVQKITDIEPRIEWHTCEEDKMQDSIERFIRPFTINDNQPLVAIAIFKHSEFKHTLVFNIHHLICDGLSMNILSKELIQLLKGVALPSTNAQFQDYIMWEQEYYQGHRKDRDEQYWLETFSNYKTRQGLIPYENRLDVQSFQGEQVVIPVPLELHKGIRLLCASLQVTPFIGWMAIYNIFLAKLTNQDRVVVGVPVSGRSHTNLENVIGMFVNTIPIQSPAGEAINFSQYVQQLKITMVEAMEHQNYPLDELVEKLELPITLGRSPLFNTTFAYEQMTRKTVVVEGLVIEMNEGINDKAAMFDLSCTCVECDEMLEVQFDYNTLLYQERTIEELISHLLELANTIVNKPEINLINYQLQLSESSFVAADWDDAQYTF